MEAKKAQELAAKISQLVNHSQFPELPKIEHDLLLQHIRTLYEEVSAPSNTTTPTRHTEKQPEELLIRRTFRANENLLLNDTPPAKEQTPPKPEVKKEPVVQEIKKEAPPVVQPVKEIIKEGIKETTPTPEVQLKQAEIATVAPAKVSASINESIHAATGSLNERIKTSGKEIHKVIASKHLKDMIDLNKRYVFVNELFKGNKDAFSFAVNHIDEIADYTSADAFIRSQLIDTHKWDENSAPVKSFMELVRYKFGVE